MTDRPNNAMIHIPDTNQWVNRFRIGCIQHNPETGTVRLHIGGADDIITTPDNPAEWISRLLQLVRYGEDDYASDPLIARLGETIMQLRAELEGRQ